MIGFTEFLKKQGVGDAVGLTEFVSEFLEDPGLFFRLSDAEREQLAADLDQALDVIKTLEFST